jgi:citrate synthase
MALADQAGVEGRYLSAASALEQALHRALGKTLPINIDGAMAAILCEIDFPAGLANALFMVSRLTGILAHAQEEQAQMPPMRRIDPVDHGYCGPPPRPLFPTNEGMPHD